MSRIQKSTDGGVSWSAVNNGLPSTTLSSARAVAVARSGPAAVYAGLRRGLLQEHGWRQFLDENGHRDACPELASPARHRRRSDHAEHGLRGRKRQDLSQRTAGPTSRRSSPIRAVGNQHHDCAERLPGCVRRFGEQLRLQVSKRRDELDGPADGHRERGCHTPDRPQHGLCRRAELRQLRWPLQEHGWLHGQAERQINYTVLPVTSP